MDYKPTPEYLENRKKWVAALRSGEYKQGKGYLRYRKFDDDKPNWKFCCLGVACEILNIEKRKIEKRPKADMTYYNAVYSLLPMEAIEKLGFKSQVTVNIKNGYWTNKKISKTPLWELNDTRNWSFNEIADIIEEQHIKPYEAENERSD